MSRLFALFLVTLVTALPAPAAQAAVLGTYSHDYGKNAYVPQNTDGPFHTALGNSIRVDGLAPAPIYDVFDFSDLAGEPIHSLSLTIDFRGAGSQALGALAPEAWDVRVAGVSGGWTAGSIIGRLDDAQNQLTFSFTSYGDTATASPFADALADYSVGVWFEQNGLLPGESFRLFSASLTVSSVPLPATVMLLLSALAALALVGRITAGRGDDVGQVPLSKA